MPKGLQCFIFAILLPAAIFAGKINYSVHFIGLDDSKALKTLKAVSDLTTLQDRPPASINALRYRADSDIPELLKVLHAHGYYEATVATRIEEAEGDVEVFVMIQPGPVYTIEEYTVHLYCSSPENKVSCERIDLKSIGIEIGKPALATEILEAELKVLTLLSDSGYPLAEIENREMIADGATKTFRIQLFVQTGPLSRFGPATYQGLTEVKPEFVERKTAWKTGATYASHEVEETQKKMMDSGLFSSVFIAHDTQLNASGELPMKFDVAESKHKSINVGVSYQTFFGPGITFGWENRDVGGLGRKLTLQGDLTRKTHSGSATYFVPDFFTVNQDYVAQAVAMHEKIFTYAERSYSVANRVERRIGDKYLFSAGIKLERMIVGESVANGTFTLLEIPLYFRWSSANNLLNPTKGATLEYKMVPSGNFAHINRYYLYQSLTHTNYFPMTASHFLVLAQQIILEAIWCSGLDAVPVPKRILGGTEQELRGYRYRTVSPLEGHHPKGGLSGIFYTFETRFRVSKAIGLVPFFDIGSVYMQQIPDFHQKWFKSAGLGIRYFSFLGPLRFDIAFPLDRRKGIDPLYRILVSIGQTF
jgi:translocation and assembly module TamA